MSPAPSIRDTTARKPRRSLPGCRQPPHVSATCHSRRPANAFRRTQCYGEAVSTFLEQHEPSLQALYDFYSTPHSGPSTDGHSRELEVAHVAAAQASAAQSENAISPKRRNAFQLPLGGWLLFVADVRQACEQVLQQLSYTE